MKLTHRRTTDKVDQEINVSPLIDVVFILLIFFIVSATFVSLPGVEINRPRVETAKSLQRNAILFALSNGMEEITPIEEEPADAVEVDANEGELPADALPPIGECVCPNSSTGTLEEK